MNYSFPLALCFDTKDRQSFPPHPLHSGCSWVPAPLGAPELTPGEGGCNSSRDLINISSYYLKAHELISNCVQNKLASLLSVALNRAKSAGFVLYKED